MRGKKIVLAASDSESSEYLGSTWRQMLLATLPARYARYMGTRWSLENEVQANGLAKYVPHGLRIIEALLLTRFSPDDVAVCYPDQLEQFVGDDTRAVGIHAHNPIGITFATDIYPAFYGREIEPINAASFHSLIEHPALRRHRPHLKVIGGGPGAWQIEKKEKDSKWCVIPTLFVPLEDTRLESKASAKLFELTDLQREFFFTCWRYNVDFWRKQASVQWKFNLGVPIYYYLLGRKLFGRAMKYPLYRFGHIPERFLRGKLYLDFGNGRPSRHAVPDFVPIPEERQRPQMPRAS